MDNRDFNLYKIFLTLYELKSISKTANKLYVSQPAISYSLKELEAQLGYNLFYRNSKGIEPTMEANELYSYISTAFNIIKSGEEHINNLNSLNIGKIKIGAHSHLASIFLVPFISEFNKLYPGVKFEIITKSSTELVKLLETRKIDLIISTLPINISNKAANKIILANLKNCFIYNKDKMQKCSIVTYEDITKYPLILPCNNSQDRIKLNEYMDKKSIKLDSSIESNNPEFILEMVREGTGIGYLPYNIVENQLDKNSFKIVDFNNSLPDIDICCIYLQDFEIPVLTKFVNYINKNN